MPRTLANGFDTFHSMLIPSSQATEAATKHRATIKASIEKIYTLQYFFQSGSSGNSTDIAIYSDVDYMAMVPTKELKINSNTLLIKIRDQLSATFPNTGVHIRSPAVVVPFGVNGSETTEITPGDFRKFVNRVAVYEIADGNGGWLKTAPKAHNTYVTNINISNDFKLKPFIRFIKAWKYYNNVDLASFYLEMRAAKYVESYCSSNSKLDYLVDLLYFFKELKSVGLSQLQDPTGVVGYISPCNTEIKKDNALLKIDTAVSRLEKALEATKNGDTKQAFVWLGLLFNNRFPGYYF